MLVSSVLKAREAPIQSIDGEKTVQDAIDQLVEFGIGSLLVTNSRGELSGIITERDILRESAVRSDKLKETKVAKIMTADLVTGTPEDKVGVLLGVMTQNRIRHLPIMCKGELVGLVSIGDLVKAQVDEIEKENQHLKEYIQGG